VVPITADEAPTPGDAAPIPADAARILVVCTGNICRSPFIERLLQHELDQRRSGSGPGIVVRSAGTGALVGSAMDEQAAAQLVAHGGDPSGFSARDLSPALIDEADLVLTATRGHRGKVALMSPKALRRVFTFRDFADLIEGNDEISATPTPADQPGWVREVTERAAARRGLKPPLTPDLADIVDPFRREPEVFAVMARQIAESMPLVVRALAG
jgi:protein-tyrosine phosphatase